MKSLIRTRKGSLLALVATIAMLPASAALAASTLDQAHEPVSSFARVALADQVYAQTFTAGLSGTLTHVELQLAERSVPAGDLLVELQSVTSGAPDGGVLASGTILASAVDTDPSWVSVDLNAVSVEGTQYALVVSATAAPADCASTDCGYTWVFDYDDTQNTGYGSGRLFQQNGPDSWTPIPGGLEGADGAFRTYVDDGGSGEQPTTESLKDDVLALGDVKGGKQLVGKLDGAQAAFDRGNVAGACRKMDQFIGQVTNMAADMTIESADADALIADAESVKADFGCDTLSAPGNKG